MTPLDGSSATGHKSGMADALMAGDGRPGTRWAVVLVAFGAGIVAATHIGKLPPALPIIRSELGASLVLAGWIASMISATGFALGLVAGSLADRFGLRRVLLSGLGLLCAGSLLGATAESGSLMLVSRFIEGLGFTATTVTGAAIIVRTTGPSERRWALGIWSSYLPFGFAGAMVSGALVLDAIGWRNLWIVCAATTLLWALLVWRMTAGLALGPAGSSRAGPLSRNVGRVLRSWGGLASAGCFAVYAASNISMMAWLPTYMQETRGSDALLAALVPAAVLIFNAGGNWVTARLMGRGVPIWVLMLGGASGMGLTELIVFSAALPDWVRFAALLAYGAIGGLIPAAALGSVTVYTPSPALTATMNGLIVTGTNTGQLFGPPALAAARTAAGNWDGVLWLLLCLSAAGILLALVSRRLERRL